MKTLSFYCQDATLVAMDAASNAAQSVVLHHFYQTKQIRQKEDGTWVSNVDEEAEEVLCQNLKKHFPEIPFLGEEKSKNQKDRILNTPGPLWIVDPLDGTSNYLHQVPLFCTSIALVYNQKPIVALIHQPLLNEKYSAILGCGAQKQTQTGQASSQIQKMTLSQKQAWSQALISMEVFPVKRRASQKLQELGRIFMSKAQGIRNMGSAAYALALVAQGAFDLFYAESLHPWDKAAGILLVEEAGGKVQTDFLYKDSTGKSSKESKSRKEKKEGKGLLTGPILAGKKSLVESVENLYGENLLDRS